MDLTEENQEKLSIFDKAANAVMWWIGSIQSLVAHTILFISVFLLPIFTCSKFGKNTFGINYNFIFRSHLFSDFHTNVREQKQCKYL